MIREINGFTYSVHLYEKHCFQITFKKKVDEMYQTKKIYIYRVCLSVDSKTIRNIISKDFVLVQEYNKEFDFKKCFDDSENSFNAYNAKVEEIRTKFENIIGCNDNETIECLDTNYLNTILFAPYLRECFENIFVTNYLDEQIKEISKELK